MYPLMKNQNMSTVSQMYMQTKVIFVVIQKWTIKKFKILILKDVIKYLDPIFAPPSIVCYAFYIRNEIDRLARVKTSNHN